jgi:hypothetical protein
MICRLKPECLRDLDEVGVIPWMKAFNLSVRIIGIDYAKTVGSRCERVVDRCNRLIKFAFMLMPP